ncbi:thioesterase domain-containing protein [Nocardiopsis sediminis]|uniref:Thioesterase domain-containing protein n=1 Tax=Nocardiopsis sediminis TaxID=1778267 RepID=A0ABV8FU20_9ACTN
MSGARVPAPWVRRFAAPHSGTQDGHAAAPARTLLCFPHAGGAASAYRGWAALVPEGVEVWAVQYPGREDRVGAPLIDDMAALAGAAVAAIGPALHPPVTVFGHSMGASVAHEFTLALERRRPGLADRLVVSGRPGPAAQAPPADPVHLRDDAGVRAALKVLGGGGLDALADPQLAALLMPVIRNDFRLIERYRPGTAPLGVDVVGVTGDADPSMPARLIDAWGWATTGAFTPIVLPGGHFYLNDHLPAVIDTALTPTRHKEQQMSGQDPAVDAAQAAEAAEAVSVAGLRATIAEVLGVEPGEVDPDASLFELGLNSMSMMSLSVRWQALGVEAPFGELAERPTVAAWSELLTGILAAQGEAPAGGDTAPTPPLV